MVAAKTGDEDELKRTIEEGVDVNYQNEVLIWKDILKTLICYQDL